MPKRKPRHRPVLDPIDRAGEAIFGVLMAVTITGTLSVATTGKQEIRTMLFTALGCNLAWGLTDAVMYLVSVATEKHRNFSLLQQLQGLAIPGEANRMIVEVLPKQLAEGLDNGALDEIRKCLVAMPIPARALTAGDYTAALGVFAVVILATFPVVIPFLCTQEVMVAMRVSNALAVVAFYAYGHLLGTIAGGTAWRYGLAIATLGVALVTIIIALGG